MAFEKPLFTHTFPASTGLQQYQAVSITGANNRLIDPTTEGNAIGILCSSGTTGSTGRAGSTDSGSVQTVQIHGIAKMIAGTTTVTNGSLIKASTDGLASTASSTSYRIGMSLSDVSSTSTSAQLIDVLLTPALHNSK